MPSQDPHNRGGTTCRDADTHYSIYCSSTQRLQLIPIAWLPNFAQLPQTPPCCALRQALVFVFFVFSFFVFCSDWTAGEFLLAVGRHLNWGHLHLSSALSPGPVSVDTFLIPFLDHAVTLDCPPSPHMDYSGSIVDCSELSKSAGDLSQLSPHRKHKEEGRGQTLELCAIFSPLCYS